MRSGILAAIQSALTANPSIKASTELPWNQSGEPLYTKNMKKVYVDQEYREEDLLIPTLDNANVYKDDIICRAFLCVDNKNLPSGLDSAVTAILATKVNTNEVNFAVESDYRVETQEDRLIYTFEFRASTVKI